MHPAPQLGGAGYRDPMPPHRRMIRCVRLLIMMSMSIVVAGCATPAAPPPSAETAGQAEAAATDLAAEQFVRRPGDAPKRFVLRRGTPEQPERSVIIRAAATDRDNADWQIEEFFPDATGNDEPQPRRTVFIREAEDGSIVMPAMLDHQENALTRFVPPLLIAPRTLAPGSRVESEAEMRVVSPDNEQFQRDSGSARRTIEHTGVARVNTPAGTFDAQRIRITFEADLTFADAHDVSVMFYVPERGLVAEERTREINILGLSNRRTSETLLLADEAVETDPIDAP